MAEEQGAPPVDPTRVAYVYMQVADHVAAQIEVGALRPGARLAGERDLAEQYGVAIGTVRRAIQELRDRGLLVTLPAKGTFVPEQLSADDADLDDA
ncbi:winged helix-turn-helix transcriptional regulator [Streptomyces rectiverticillatus]|uniref:winged helix-turn-helix domain-containing protein n=1 Tax=Streptomyces rectiverticillatus TaxID=173860 RepID=UPI0015C39B9F|nr:winged helix-turn-helix domain-containing protein [Streptomyces rectiverticillatus]QLE73252.1 winged helix-turn-helix transcriptional regulator [Streptomyces rectiverticillatus]